MPLDKNKITKEAQKFASKGQYDKAIAEWKKLLKETPNDPNLFNTIGDLCLKKNKKSEAVDAYRQAADLLAQDGFTSKAIAMYKKVLNIDPKKIEVHLLLGDLNAEKGLTGNALESYKVVADHYQKSNDMGKALGIYRKMADLNPGNVAFRSKLADMYAKEGMKKEAADAYLSAATVHIGANKFNDARQLFEKVLALDPDNKEVYHKAGIVYFKEGKFAEACKAFKPAFESDPANEELTDLYLEALTKAGREDAAAEIYERILAQDPSRTELRQKLFHMHLEKSEPDKAFAEAQILADEQVKKMLAAAAEQGHRLLPGAVLPGAEEETEAEEALKAFIEKHPDFVDARRTLSEFYEKVGRKEGAARELARAGGILISAGDRDAARDLLNRALELWPGLDEAERELNRLESAAPAPAEPSAPPATEEDPAVGEGLTEADVLLKYGLAAKALEQLEALAQRFPDSMRVRTRLRDICREQGEAAKAASHAVKAADICEQEGKHDQAESLLREALEINPGNTEVLSRLGIAPPEEAEPAPASIEELPAFDAPGGTGEEQPGFGLGEPAVSPDFGDALSFEEPVLPEAGPPAAVEETVPEPEGIDFDQEAAGPGEASLELAAEGGELAAPVRELASEPEAKQVDPGEVWSEAEFYYQQGLFDEARRKYEMILEQKPDDPRTLKRLEEISRQKEEVSEFASLAEAVEGLESFVPGGELAGGELATSTSDEEAVQSLMQDIRSMRQQERERELEQEYRERESAEREQQEARLRAEQEARERAEQELRELRERFDRERRERADLDAREQEERLRAEQEARERAEQELQELRERFEIKRRERREAAEQAASWEGQTEFKSSAASEDRETDFSGLGDDLATMLPSRSDRREPDGGFGGIESSTRAGEGEASEDFFDLAAELRDELGSVPLATQAAGDADGQTLDDIFEDFKRGVEEQERSQDLNTHYNLGIAYKEMGLLEDAIAEFLMTSEGEPRFVESRYMLGLCFMEQGEFHKAVAEIHNALNYAVSFGGTEEDRVGMLYDLGLAYQGAGNINEAISAFQQIADQDPSYRDAAEKLKELRAGEFVSLEELKEDIEREISSKFLEEGERIEREEKTRKNDAVRG